MKKIRTTLKEVEELNDRLQADKDSLNKRLGKHDIGNLAENKPGLVEKIINKASDSAARCVEIASGSSLTEEELNGAPNRECPSFWPSDNTTE
jgi:inosine/xanthosine triphosphate pyrophosphatase family protein